MKNPTPASTSSVDFHAAILRPCIFCQTISRFSVFFSKLNFCLSRRFEFLIIALYMSMLMILDF